MDGRAQACREEVNISELSYKQALIEPSSGGWKLT